MMKIAYLDFDYMNLSSLEFWKKFSGDIGRICSKKFVVVTISYLIRMFENEDQNLFQPDIIDTAFQKCRLWELKL